MLLTTLAFAFAQGIANIMDNLNYQVVGIMVVMLCLGGMAVILTVSGSIAAAIQNRAKAKTAAPVAVPAAAPAAATAAPAPAPKAAPALATGVAGECKLYNVGDREAAMLMAIVADKMGKPLNTLRFKSMKEVI